MWDSPIKIIYKDIDMQLEAGVIKAVKNASIYVDKDELLKALQYDRDQYQLGFLDGKIKAMEEIVHCKDCKHQRKLFHADARREDGGYFIYWCDLVDGYSHVCLDDDYCSKGERREE